MIARGVVLSAAFLIAGCITLGPPRPCIPEANQHLQNLGVPAGAIETVTIRSDQASGSDSSLRILGNQAWVRIRNCSGYLVVAMNRECDLERTYFHQSECTLAGKREA